jgi:hypothetical protein
MGQSIKLSDALVQDARLAAKFSERTIAGQVEFWARIGKAIEPCLRGEQATALLRKRDAEPLSESLK